MYVMDLEKTIVNGKWEGNIGRVNRASIQIWTGKRFTGTRINNYYTSGSIEDTKLKVIGEDGLIYISYDEVDKVEEDAEKIRPPLEVKPRESVFVEEKLLERILDRVNELEIKEGPSGEKGEQGEPGKDGKDGADGTIEGLTASQIIDVLGYTPADEDNIDLSATNISIEDEEGLFVADNVEGALEELFTNVSDGKDLIAGAITDKDESVVIPSNPTFGDLADGIGEISSRGKSASGTLKITQSYAFTITGLDFITKSLKVVGPTWTVVYVGPSNYNTYYRNDGTLFSGGPCTVTPTSISGAISESYGVTVTWEAYE